MNNIKHEIEAVNEREEMAVGAANSNALEARKGYGSVAHQSRDKSCTRYRPCFFKTNTIKGCTQNRHKAET